MTVTEAKEEFQQEIRDVKSSSSLQDHIKEIKSKIGKLGERQASHLEVFLIPMERASP